MPTVLPLQVYAEYAPYQFLAYWHELWRDYETLVGPFAELDPQCYALLTGMARPDLRSRLPNPPKPLSNPF